MGTRKPGVRFLKIAFSLLILLVVIYIGVQLCLVSYDFGYRVFTESAVESGEGTQVLIQIKDNMSDYDVAVAMKEKGLVRSAPLFCIQLQLFEYADKMEPGVYTLSTSMTPKEIMVAIEETAEEEAEYEAVLTTEAEPVDDLFDDDGDDTEVGVEE